MYIYICIYVDMCIYISVYIIRLYGYMYTCIYTYVANQIRMIIKWAKQQTHLVIILCIMKCVQCHFTYIYIYA